MGCPILHKPRLWKDGGLVGNIHSSRALRSVRTLRYGKRERCWKTESRVVQSNGMRRENGERGDGECVWQHMEVSMWPAPANQAGLPADLKALSPFCPTPCPTTSPTKSYQQLSHLPHPITCSNVAPNLLSHVSSYPIWSEKSWVFFTRPCKHIPKVY